LELRIRSPALSCSGLASPPSAAPSVRPAPSRLRERGLPGCSRKRQPCSGSRRT